MGEMHRQRESISSRISGREHVHPDLLFRTRQQRKRGRHLLRFRVDHRLIEPACPDEKACERALDRQLGRFCRCITAVLRFTVNLTTSPSTGSSAEAVMTDCVKSGTALRNEGTTVSASSPISRRNEECTGLKGSAFGFSSEESMGYQISVLADLKFDSCFPVRKIILPLTSRPRESHQSQRDRRG